MGTDYSDLQSEILSLNEPEFLFKEETYRIIGVCMEVHKELGHGFREIVYKNAIEFEFGERNIFYEGEKEFQVVYKGKILQHCF